MSSEKSAKPWYLYIIQTKYAQLYTGITLDWHRRYAEHEVSGVKTAKALKGKGPLILRYVCQCPNRRTAMQAEIWVKKQSRASKVAIIEQAKEIPFIHQIINIIDVV